MMARRFVFLGLSDEDGRPVIRHNLEAPPTAEQLEARASAAPRPHLHRWQALAALTYTQAAQLEAEQLEAEAQLEQLEQLEAQAEAQLEQLEAQAEAQLEQLEQAAYEAHLQAEAQLEQLEQLEAWAGCPMSWAHRG